MVKSIHTNFPALFDQDDEEREDGEDAARDAGETGKGSANPFQSFGITPFVLTYCRVACTPIAEVYKSSVIHLFYIVSYETERKRKENEELKKYRRSGYGGF